MYDPNTGQDDGSGGGPPPSSAAPPGGNAFDNTANTPISRDAVLNLYKYFMPGYAPGDSEISAHLQNPGGIQGLTKQFEQQFGKPYNLSPAGAPPPAAPPPKTGTGGPGTAGDLMHPNIPPPVNLGGPAGIPYVPPTPQFTPPSYTPPPAFELPTAQQASNDPGYQFSLNQGLGALQNSAAAKGVLNTGGTLKGLEDYGQAAGATQYQNVLNRLLQQYQTNYQTQYMDPYQVAFQNAAAQFAPQMTGYQTQAAAGQHQTDLNTATAFNTWLQQWNMKYGAATAQ